MRDVEVNVAYRWFLGYTMSQQLPHFATISYAFRHRFTADVIEAVFRWVLEEVACAGYLSPEVVFVDGTHIKANANMKQQVKKQQAHLLSRQRTLLCQVMMTRQTKL